MGKVNLVTREKRTQLSEQALYKYCSNKNNKNSSPTSFFQNSCMKKGHFSSPTSLFQQAFPHVLKQFIGSARSNAGKASRQACGRQAGRASVSSLLSAAAKPARERMRAYNNAVNLFMQESAAIWRA